MNKELLTPAAILLGSCIIAAGAYFGLQRAPLPTRAEGRDGEPADDAAEPSAALQSERQEPPRPAAAMVQPAAASDPRERVRAAATRVLEARRAELVQRCWEPSVKKNPSPPRAKYIFNMTFDASGKEIARGISEVRGMDRPETGQCLRMLPLGVHVPAPGTSVAVDVEMTLP